MGPLVASIGGLGLVVGLASQSLAANLASALAIYSGRPFVVGDRVELLARGSRVVEVRPAVCLLALPACPGCLPARPPARRPALPACHLPACPVCVSAGVSVRPGEAGPE